MHTNLPRHARLVRALTDMSYSQLFGLWASVVVVAAVSYNLLTYVGGGIHAPYPLADIEDPLARLWNALYFSVITATSTGYGDIVPLGYSKGLAATQSILSGCVFALFVAKLISHRQDIALRHIHNFAFEEVFHNIQEELAALRRSFTRIAAQARAGEPLEKEDWGLLAMSLEQGQSVVSDIPDLYDAEEELYVLDARREHLVQRSVQRTLGRINELLDALSAAGVEWHDQTDFVAQLHMFSDIVQSTTVIWRQKSPHNVLEPFEDILDLKENILGHLKESMQR